ncbi:hypothetical protein B0H11DRAFT_2254333 [Mycena galericulata]|nr:hypothetical protein B0H11DRAFT_2254333 [Mycena galericulata]
MSKEAISDVLEFTFNTLMHYPSTGDGTKVLGGSGIPSWIPSSHPSSASSTRCPQHPPRLSPPAHARNSFLIAITVSASLRSDWFGARPVSGSSSPRRPPPPVVIPPSPRRGDSTSSSSGSGNSRTGSPIRAGTPTHTSPRPSTLDRALSVLAAGRRSLSRSLTHPLGHLAVALAHYFPDAIEVDDVPVRVKAESAAASGNGATANADAVDDELSHPEALKWRTAGDLDESLSWEESLQARRQAPRAHDRPHQRPPPRSLPVHCHRRGFYLVRRTRHGPRVVRAPSSRLLSQLQLAITWNDNSTPTAPEASDF